ncbi:MAG: biotin--[acetyl-CoA-carboxylase] ligase [Campylobacteraceae bacterium]|nr:biotin--[acetyl-CoA-carboxylase] ligase [Campylobacteraceae bacterium]MBT4573157.1 biotin--[acetyl-CoA-carboxylase] ligase [Campylobacteraceae bacterium]MBT5324307.1 biotin--[acetyl-CoA-carboxylase] ligase [Campylobacteraceae bacterium]MBT5982688.1 biotin--[acetyl-CoA-carboxylase] ligase [Campylobacteraceae bacterium]MBT6388902.1 biotin--[acetyl-CoA-carboxylase] ligase [Campylobacteraceae bacterium]
MEILYLKSVNSTQTYIKDYIRKNGYNHPVAIVTQNQTNGIGSQNNSWDGKEGNLFFSFVISRSTLPEDLPLQSASIYFSFMLKEILEEQGSYTWIKWPNDFYINNKKIGGTITSVNKDLIYCGIGINLSKVDDNYGFLDIDITIEKLLNRYFQYIKKSHSWKTIFSKFVIEFGKNNNFTTNINGSKIILKSNMLQPDGSLQIDDKKVFSLR